MAGSDTQASSPRELNAIAVSTSDLGLGLRLITSQCRRCRQKKVHPPPARPQNIGDCDMNLFVPIAKMSATDAL